MNKEIKIIYDEKIKTWKDDNYANYFYLKEMEYYFTYRLRIVGYVLLSEIYESIGLDKSNRFEEHIFKYRECQEKYFDFKMIPPYLSDNPNIELTIEVC